TRGRLGPAPKTRTKTCLSGGGSARVVADVDASRASNRADWPAVDSRRDDGNKELAVEPRIAADTCAIEPANIEADAFSHRQHDARPTRAPLITCVTASHAQRSPAIGHPGVPTRPCSGPTPCCHRRR